MNNPSIAITLNRLLDANAGFALGGRGTTTHCPMALCALAGMGASSDRLQEFFDQWQRRFGVAASVERVEITHASWSDFQGNPGAFLSLRDFFKAWIMHSSMDTVLAAVLTRIPFSPATGAFHAVIRLAYGVEAAHSGEIAAGLAALVVENLQVDRLCTERERAASVESAFERLAIAFEGKKLPPQPTITAKLQAIATDPVFQTALQAAPGTPDLLDSLAKTAIALYWQKPDFTSLHMVTGMDAIRRVASRLPETMLPALERETWSAFCAAYVAIGTPLISPPPRDSIRMDLSGAPLPPWATLLACAINSDDDHVIKMTYTCWRADKQDMELIYRAAVAKLIAAESEG